MSRVAAQIIVSVGPRGVESFMVVLQSFPFSIARAEGVTEQVF